METSGAAAKRDGLNQIVRQASAKTRTRYNSRDNIMAILGQSGAIPDQVPVSNQNNLLNVQSNKQYDASKRANLAEVGTVDPFISGLVSHVRNHWESAKSNKWQIEDRLLGCMRKRKGVYDSDDLKHIQQFGGSQIFMMICNVKCRAIESWIKDVLLPPGEKPWDVGPTPVADLPVAIEEAISGQVAKEVQEIADSMGGDLGFVTPDIVSERLDEIRREVTNGQRKEAIKEAESLATEMNDVLTEGDFYKEIESFIKDFATYPTAFLKGPIVQNKKVLKWVENEEGKKRPEVVQEPKRYWKRVSPFDMYFAPGSRYIGDGFLFERIRMRRNQIAQMKGVPGYNDAAIDAVLLEDIAGTMQDWLWTDQERANLEDRPNELTDPEGIIQALEYHGWASGKQLKEWGMKDKKVKDPAKMYPVTLQLIDRWVIMARLNADPMEKVPYYGASFDSSNDSIWGNAPPELMEDCQRVCNAAARAVVNNMAISSGPQVEVSYDRMKATEDTESIYPWKIWRTKSDPMGKNREAVRFYQPTPMVDSLLIIYDQFFRQAGEQLGVPAYEHGGGQQGGAGKTAHGLSMLMSASSKIIKDAIVNIDTNVIKPVIKDCFINMMLYDDLDYDGDINIVARASEYLVIAEQLQVRQMEFLDRTANPIDMEIIGMPGRAEILRETVKSLKLPSEDIVPDREEMQERQAIMAQQQEMMQAGGEVGPDGMPIDTGVAGGGAIPDAPVGPTSPGIDPSVEGSSLPTIAPGPRD